MVDRIKYFLLGLLFLIVAGVIAYDSWNSSGADDPVQTARGGDDDAAERVEINVRNGPAEPTPRPSEPSLSFYPDPDVVQPQPRPRRPVILPPPTPRPAPSVKPQPSAARTHLVRSGESLERIALHYYNTRKGIAWIVSANSLKNANRIYVNQKLVIPARKESVKSPRTPATKPTTTPKTLPKIPSAYTVKKSDGDLYAIARRFYGKKGQGARVASIMELNGIWSATVLPGTKLTLPPK